MATEIRLAEVLRLLRKHSWVLVRVRGWHHVFRKPDGSVFSIPVHHSKVKAFYVREIKKQFGGS